jgi:hypothetical protein
LTAIFILPIIGKKIIELVGNLLVLTVGVQSVQGSYWVYFVEISCFHPYRMDSERGEADWGIGGVEGVEGAG